MRYHFEKKRIPSKLYGESYICDHPLYNSCTLFRIEEKGLAVIQQRFNSEDKTTWWGEVDADVIDAVYLHPEFKDFFDSHAKVETDGLYPTVTIRHIMWSLKMKPLPKKEWETVFTRKDI